MSIHVIDFKWEKGKNDLKYIELLEKTLKNEQAITAKAVAKIRKLSAENKEIRNQTIAEFAKRLKEVCSKNAMAIDRETNKPLYGKDGVWQDLIDDITEEMRGAE